MYPIDECTTTNAESKEPKPLISGRAQDAIDSSESSSGLVRSCIIVGVICVIVTLGLLEDGRGFATRRSIKGLGRFVFDLGEGGGILLSLPLALIDNVSTCFIPLERATLIVLLAGSFLLLLIMRFLGFGNLGVVLWIWTVG